MNPIQTSDLMNALHAAPGIDRYLQDNESHLVDDALPQRLEKLLLEKGCSKGAVIRGAEINEIYGYQIFAGTRRPSRDKLLCLGLSMELTEEEIQALLKAAGMASLYPKNKRDSIILFGFLQKQSVPQVNDALFTHGESTL